MITIREPLHLIQQLRWSFRKSIKAEHLLLFCPTQSFQDHYMCTWTREIAPPRQDRAHRPIGLTQVRPATGPRPYVHMLFRPQELLLQAYAQRTPGAVYPASMWFSSKAREL